MISILCCSWLPLPPCLSLSPRLVCLHDLHSGLLFDAALSSKLVTLHDFPCAALSPKLVLLHDFPSGLLLAAATSQACLISVWATLGCCCHLVSQACVSKGGSLRDPHCLPSLSPFMIFLATLSPKVVSLHGLHSGLRLAAAAALSPKYLVSLYDLHCLPRLSPFMIFLAVCAALSPKLVALHAALGCRLSPFMISLLGCSWRPLPPCLRSLSPFMISLLAAAAALSPSWFPFLISLSSLSWLPLPPYLLPCFPS